MIFLVCCLFSALNSVADDLIEISPFPTLWAMSAFGQHVGFFRQDKGLNGPIMPWQSSMVLTVEIPPPIDWWSYDLLTQEGQETFMEIMLQVGKWD
jgi:hypothetical protein